MSKSCQQVRLPGKFSRQTLIARILCHLHIFITSHTWQKIPTWKLFKITPGPTEKSKTEKSPCVKKTKTPAQRITNTKKERVAMRCFSREIVIYILRHSEVLFFHWFAVLLGVIISRRGAGFFRNLYKLKSRIWFLEECFHFERIYRVCRFDWLSWNFVRTFQR